MMQHIEVDGIPFSIEQRVDGTYLYTAPDGRGFASKSSAKWERGVEDHRRSIATYLRVTEDD